MAAGGKLVVVATHDGRATRVYRLLRTVTTLIVTTGNGQTSIKCLKTPSLNRVKYGNGNMPYFILIYGHLYPKHQPSRFYKIGLQTPLCFIFKLISIQ